MLSLICVFCFHKLSLLGFVSSSEAPITVEKCQQVRAVLRGGPLGLLQPEPPSLRSRGGERVAQGTVGGWHPQGPGSLRSNHSSTRRHADAVSWLQVSEPPTPPSAVRATEKIRA